MINVFIFAGIGFLISFISMPIIITLCKKYECYDYSDERKIHTGKIPRLGGIGIVIGFFISTILYLIFTDEINFWQTFPLILAGTIVFVFGILDDFKNLRAIIKLFAQIVAALIVVFSGFRFKQIFNWTLSIPISYILTICWIIGVINAYNLIDGLDGLSGTLTFTTSVTLGILYFSSGNFESGVCFCLAAAILGFLCFNWPPAKIFMGDSGSQFLGFVIAILPFYTTSSDSFEFNKFFMVIVLTSFPVFDTIAAIWRRLREHRSVMSPDASHLHHKLLHLGFSKKATLVLVLIFQILLCVTVVLSYCMSKRSLIDGIILLSVAIVFMIVFFAIIHFTNRAVIQKTKRESSSDYKNNAGGGVEFYY